MQEMPIASTMVINPPAKISDPDIALTEPAEPSISAKQTIAFVTKILYDLFPLQRLKIHELIELTAYKILKTRTPINHTGQPINFE
jgi:hypothetical protein